MNKLVDLFIKYKHELWEYTGQHFSDEEVADWFADYSADNSVKIIPICKFGNPIGFVVIQDIDWKVNKYIVDCYIEPEYRRQGIMTAHLDTILASEIGNNVCMYVIKNNEPAVEFWRKFFEDHGYKVKLGKGLPGMEVEKNELFYICKRG